MIVDDWAHYLDSIRALAVQKKLRMDKVTLDVLLNATKKDGMDLGEALEVALMESMVAEEQGEPVAEPEPSRDESEGEAMIRMQFDKLE